MKDYLNTNEKLSIIAFLKVADKVEDFVKGNLFTKQEKSDLKRAVTYMAKAICGKYDKEGKPIQDEGLLRRLNKDALKTFNNALKDTNMFISSNAEIETYRKRKSSEIDAAYEENKEYFKLVELIIYYNCRNCTKQGCNCEFYKEFENQAIPEATGYKECSNCKYAYREDD